MKRRIWLSCLVLLSACSGRGDPSNAPAASVQAGEAALAGGMPGAAIAIAKRKLAANRDDVDALLLQAKAEAETGEFDKAVITADHAAKVKPRSIPVQLALGRALLAGGKPAEAESAFRKAIAMDRNDGAALTNLGIALDLQGKHREAQVEHHRAIAAAPMMDAARVNLAMSLALGGDPTAAVAILRPMAASPSATRRVRHDLAMALTLAGRQTEARQILRADLSQKESRQATDAYARLGNSVAVPANQVVADNAPAISDSAEGIPGVRDREPATREEKPTRKRHRSKHRRHARH